MANINLYKIDPLRINDSIENIEGSLTESKSINYNEFTAKLYVGDSYEEKELSWSWILKAFKQNPVKNRTAPRAVVLLQKQDTDILYAVTFGSAFFMIDKYCDRDFGFNFACRIQFNNIKTTTLTSPNLKKSRTVNTYVDYDHLDFTSGESFSKLKINMKQPDGFKLFKPSLEVGTAIKFITDQDNINGILRIICYVENVLKGDIVHHIPLFNVVKDETLLEELNKQLYQNIQETILGNENISQIVIPELDIIATHEIFNRCDNVGLTYKRKREEVSHLSINGIRKFCGKYFVTNPDDILKIKVVRSNDGKSLRTDFLHSLIEYTSDDKQCIFYNGKWYSFNDDYLDYLNASMSEIDTRYNSAYDFDDEVHQQFLDAKYEELENIDSSQKEDNIEEVKKNLAKKYYAERCFNILRAEQESFDNYDRKDTSAGFEKMDLYEKKTKTMFAVKIGKASSSLCYAVDQSLVSMYKYKKGEITEMPLVERVGLWFILKRKKTLPIDNERVCLEKLDMLMLKNRIDHWKKEVRLAGFTPVVYINYRS